MVVTLVTVAIGARYELSLERMRQTAAIAGFNRTLLWKKDDFLADPLVQRHLEPLEKMERGHKKRKKHHPFDRPYCGAFKSFALHRALEQSREGDYVLWADASKYHDARYRDVSIHEAIEGLRGDRRPPRPTQPRAVSAAYAQSRWYAGVTRIPRRTARSAYGVLHCHVGNCDQQLFLPNRYRASVNMRTIAGYPEHVSNVTAMARRPHVMNANILLENNAFNRRLMRSWIKMATSKPDTFCASSTQEQGVFSILTMSARVPMVNACPYMRLEGFNKCQDVTKSSRWFLETLSSGAFEIITPSEIEDEGTRFATPEHKTPCEIMGNAMTLPETLSFDVAGPKVAGEGVPRVIAPNHTPPTVGKFGETIDNLYLQFARTASLLPGNKCMGKRTTGPDGKLGGFEFITYKTAHEQVLNIGSGLASLGMAPKSTFGLYGKNTMEWQLSALAGFSQALTCVPIYDTLGDNIVEYEANHSDMVLMFVEASKLQGVANVIAACKSLKYVVQLEPLGGSVDPKAKAAFDAAGVKLMDLNSLSETGTKAPAAPKSAGGDGLAFIMYTSGTTGDPKGVCITNMAIVAGSSWCAGLDLLPTDRHLSYLPLAHIFETMVEHGIWSVGGSVGFFPGNIKGLQDDILTLKPTIFVGVPRVYQRFYDAALQKVAALPGPLKAFLSAGLDAETIAVRTGAHTWYAPILHKLLGAKLTGGQVRIMISGAAPLPVHVQEFLLAACGGSVMQGYGMTENCANSTIAHAADHRAGHVGGPMPTCMIKLEDVPEMNYVSSDTPPAGEVVVKSVCNFAGYHKNKAETDKVLTADGWLHTGDIGRWNADGTLSIIDRKKNIFKLAQGEYVAAEKIEMAVSKSKYISQPWVYGNSFFPMLVAVVTPDFGTLSVAAKEGGWFVEGTEALAAKPEAAALILAEITSEAKAAKLKSFEIPKKVVLEGRVNELLQGFSIENDCLTPTFKLKRPQLLKKYQEQVDAMYVALGEDPSKYK